MPREHGIVGNGWYFRDLGEVLLWRQHNALVQGGQLWDAVPGAKDRQRLLVVRHGRGQRPARHAAPDLPRRRPQVARLLHPAPRRCTTTWRRARDVPAVQLLGTDRGHRLLPVDRRPPSTSCARNARTCSWCTCRTSTTTSSASAPTGPRPIAAAKSTWSPRSSPLRAEAPPSSSSPSTASPPPRDRSTSTGPCAGPGCWRCTPRPGWSISTRGPPARSPSPTTRSPTCTCATRPTAPRP